MKSTSLRFDILAMRHQLMHLYHHLFEDVLEKYGLTQMEADILLFLANNPQYDTATEIVSIRQLTKSHVSSSVERLVQKNFIERFRESKNKKIIHLKILPDAQPAIKECRKCQKIFSDIIFKDICDDDMSTFIGVLSQMIANIKEYRENNKND